MRLRRFSASDIQAAMEMVREALGDDAVILATSTDSNTGKVTVTAAIEEDNELPAAPPPPSASAMRTIASPQAGADWLSMLESLLRYHGIPEKLCGRLIYKARHMELHKLVMLEKLGTTEARFSMEQKALAELMSNMYRYNPLEFSHPPRRIMLVGPPGIGKTISAAKIATQLVMDKHHVAVITTDVNRAGGVEQLAAFTDILELKLGIADSPKELKEQLAALPQSAHVIIDSSGVNPYEKDELLELEEYINLHSFEPILTLAAGMDAHEAVDTARAFSFPAIERLLVTRADTSRRFGAVLAAADARSLALANASVSSKVGASLEAISAPKLAQWLLQYQLQSV